MNIKQSTLATAVAATLAMGVAGQAAASVYAGSALNLQDLTIVVTENGTPLPPFPTPVTSFQFTATNTATLNGVSATVGTGGTGAGLGQTSQSCGGLPGTPPAGNNCNAVIPRLDPGAANAPGSAPFRANNDFSLFGPSANTYANSDSTIYQAELTLDGPTHLQQIAESELQNSGSARGNAEITSNTGFKFTFALAGTGGLLLDFEADPYLRALINQTSFNNGNAQANLNATFSLTQDNTGDAITWSPQGTANNDCVVDGGLAGVTCTEGTATHVIGDTQDMNRNLSVSSNPNDVNYSLAAGFTGFGLTVAGLSAGNYTLALNTVTSNSIRTVPEPGMLALLGIGLLGMATASRRKVRG